MKEGYTQTEKYEGRRPKRDHDFSTMPTIPDRTSGDSGIPESCATRATTSPIARDCDRPVDEERGLPTVQSVK